MDLTSVDTPEKIVDRHYFESLFFGMHIPDARSEATLVDFGSGAGFPGFPIAVLRPKWNITLLEANQRRGVFLKEAVRGLPNARVVSKRGESFYEKHDWVVARAVKPSDVVKCMPTLGDRIGLLVGDSALMALGEAELEWQEPIRIPGSNSRCCIFGNVPRGTHPF